MEAKWKTAAHVKFCNVNVHRASMQKHLRSKKRLKMKNKNS